MCTRSRDLTHDQVNLTTNHVRHHVRTSPSKASEVYLGLNAPNLSNNDQGTQGRIARSNGHHSYCVRGRTSSNGDIYEDEIKTQECKACRILYQIV